MGTLGSTVFRPFLSRPDLHLVGHLFFAARRVASARHTAQYLSQRWRVVPLCIAWLISAVLDVRSRMLSSTTSQLLRGGVRRLSSETWSTAHTETGNMYRNLPLTKRTKSLKLQPMPHTFGGDHRRRTPACDCPCVARRTLHNRQPWHSFRSTSLVHGIRASGAFGGQQARASSCHGVCVCPSVAGRRTYICDEK